MIYEEFAPASAIREKVEALWRFRLEDHEAPEVRHLVPPDGAVNLCLICCPDGDIDVAVAGPSDRAQARLVRRGSRYAGVRLRPGGGLRLPGASPASLAHRGLTAATMEPALAAWMRQALAPLLESPAPCISTAVEAWPFAIAVEDPVVTLVVDDIIGSHGIVRIDAAARRAGVSTRTLLRRFHPTVGLTPKTLAGVRRLRRACVLSLEAGSNLAAASAEAGYADQAHLSRQALEAFGTGPAEIRGYLQQIRHAFSSAV